MFRTISYSILMLTTCSGLALANGKSSTHIIYDGHSDPSTVIEKLHTQNASLRATISAQSEVLKSSDNAAHAAEQRGQENAFLRNQVNLLQNTIKEDQQVIKDLQDFVAVLQEELAKRNALLTPAADVLPEKTALDPLSALSELDRLRTENKELESKLEKERGITSTYRAKISEYQTTIMPECQKNKNAMMIPSAVTQAPSSDEVLKVKAENQVLRARIELLEQQSSARDHY